MADLDKNYTSDQRKAVIAEGRNVLVSASAVSSGKYIPPFFDKNIDFL